VVCRRPLAREKEADMIIIGVDYHPSDQYIALVDTETGEYVERQLIHSTGEAEKFIVTDLVKLRTSGLLSRNNFRIARCPPAAA